MATDLENKIIKQVEYYFGDSNLPRDRFLQEQIKEDDGWVTLETMIKFNRLKQISDDLKVIAEAMKKSTTGLVEVNEEGTKIRRKADNPMPENTEKRRQELVARTVYAKGFPLDASLDSIQEFFETDFGEIENVFMRKNEKKTFKGSVFATFKKDEDVQKFVKAEAVKFKDTLLESWKLKSDYYKIKGEEKKKLIKEKENKKEKAQNRQDVDEKKRFENQITKGAMLHLTGFSAETTREDIKNLLQDYGPIAWVDYSKGDKEGWVRYDQEDKAKEVLEKVAADMNNEIMLNDSKLEGRSLEGEEELERWRKMFDDIRDRRQSNRTRGGGRGRRQGGARFGKRPCKAKRDAAKSGMNNDDKDGGNDSDDEPPAKQAKKVEAEGEPPAKEIKTVEAGGD